MHGYTIPDGKQIDGTILRITNIRVPENPQLSDTEIEAAFTREEALQYASFIGEGRVPQRKARTVGKARKTRCTSRSSS